MGKESSAAKAVRLLGGPVKAAEALGVERYQTVQSWVKHQVPAAYCQQIVRLLPGQISLKELRPDDWERYWPDASNCCNHKASA
jgi:DNA-binding transcriptional regulator YdaS (Cro superfamily)